MGPPGPDRSVEIGFSLVPDRRGRGYAGEAVRALVPWALRQPGVGAVDAHCDRQNAASVRVLERAGFSLIGEDAGLLHWRNDGGEEDDAV
jgi:RimJ/RimL family protein N-acetyltransferase